MGRKKIVLCVYRYIAIDLKKKRSRYKAKERDLCSTLFYLIDEAYVTQRSPNLVTSWLCLLFFSLWLHAAYVWIPSSRYTGDVRLVPDVNKPFFPALLCWACPYGYLPHKTVSYNMDGETKESKPAPQFSTYFLTSVLTGLIWMATCNIKQPIVTWLLFRGLGPWRSAHHCSGTGSQRLS